MTTQEDTIDRAIELATKGSPDEGVALLRPLVRDDPEADQALFALAYCYEKAGNLTTATYLYDWIVERHPDFTVASDRMAGCLKELDERGLSENFEDTGHVACPCGVFRQRAEYGACPYCGRSCDDSDETSAGGDRGGAMKHRAIEKFEEWVEREDLEPAKEKLLELKEKTESRVKEFAETEQAKRITARAGELGREISERLKSFTESEPVKDAAKKAKDLGQVTSDKLERIIEKPELQEAKASLTRRGADTSARVSAWLKSERVRARAKGALKAWERVLSKLQSVIDRMKER